MSTPPLIVVALLLLGALPSWPYSRDWGCGLSELAGVVLVVVLVMALLQRTPI